MDSRFRTHRVVLASLLAFFALAPSASALSRPRDLAGAALHPWRLETRSYAPLWPLRDARLREKTFARFQALGLRHARVDFKWSSVERYGTTLRDWGEMDATVTSARHHHVELEPVVTFTPSWANGGAGPFVFPKHTADFQRFMQAAMERYPDIKVWEIWNEPNTRQFSPPRPDLGKFAAMIRAAARARDAAHSHAKIVTGGVAVREGGEVPEFAVALARLGVFRYAYALGIHPYSRQSPDSDGAAFLQLAEGHRRVSRAAGRSVPFWVTEYGYPNSSVASSYGPPASEKTQAERLQKAFALAVGWPWLKRLTWYGFRDDCDDGRHPDCRFGVLRADFTPKPGWYGFQQVLAGNLPQLETRTTLHRRPRVRGRGRKRRRLHTLWGSVREPGTDPSTGTVTVTARRRYGHRKRRRRYRASLKDGRYKVSLGRLKPGRWRFQARFAGNSRYLSSQSRRLSARIRKSRASAADRTGQFENVDPGRR